jgi:hypothetical protein
VLEIEKQLNTCEHSYTFLDTFSIDTSTLVMDFRGLDRMGNSDEDIVNEPYRPFYNIFAAKPVLVKQ